MRAADSESQIEPEPENRRNRSTAALPLAAGLLAAAIWGGMYVVSDVVLEVIPPFTLLLMRLLLGLLTFWIVMVIRRAALPRTRLVPILLTGLTGYGVSLGFQFVGTHLSTAANGAVITSATPVLVAVFAGWILRERVRPAQAWALALATLGVLLVVDPRQAQLAPDTFAGNLALLAAAVTWALYSVLVRRESQAGADLLPFTFMLLIGGLPVSVPLAAAELAAGGLPPLTTGTVLGVLYLGIISTAGAMYLWNYAFARLPATSAGLAFFAQPVVGAGLSALLLGERLGIWFGVGGVLIGLGVWAAAAGAGRAAQSQDR